MTRQVTDQLYIELDYYYPEEFYVYTAEAQAVLSCTNTIDCTISNVRGADLVAFSDAALTADAIVTKDVSATIAATATIDQFAGDLYALRSASLSSEFAQTVDANRLREPQIALNSEFVFDAIVSINGAVVGSGTFTATASLDITPELYKDMGANLYADAVMDPDGVQRIRAVDSTQQAEFTQSLTFTKIVQGDCAFNALFAPSMTVEAVRNAFAVLDSTSALAVVAIANRSADIALSSIVNQSLQGDRSRDYVVNANSQFALSIEYVNTVPAQATLTSQASITDVSTRVRYAQATITGAFTPSISAIITKPGQIALTSQFTQTASVRRIRSGSAAISAQFTSAADSYILPAGTMFVISTRYNATTGISATHNDSDLVEDSFGNIYTISTHNIVDTNTSTTTYATWLQKLNPRGRVQWTKQIDTSSGNSRSNIEIIGSNLYYTIRRPGVFTVVKSDLNGNALTSKTINPSTTNNVVMNLTTDGTHLYVLGVYDYGASSQHNYTNITKLDTNLNYVDGYGFYNTNGNTTGSGTFNAPDANIALIGSNYYTLNNIAPGTGFAAGEIYRLSASPRKVQFAPTGAGNLDVFLFLDNVAYGGYLYATARWDMDMVVFKFDTNLNVIWQKKIADVGFDSTGRFAIDSTNGHLYIICNTAGTENNYLGTGGTSFIMRVNDDVSSILEAFTVESSSAISTPYGSHYMRWTDIDIVDDFIQLSGFASVDGQPSPIYAQIPKDSNNRPLQLTFTTPGRTDTLTWRPTYGSYSISTTSLTASYSTPTNVDSGGANTATMAVSTTSTPAFTTYYYFIRITGAAAITATATITANNRRLRNNPAQLTAQCSITGNAIKTARTPAQLTAQASIVPNGGYIKGASANLSSSTTVTASLGLVKRHSAGLSANTEIFVDPLYFEGGGASLNADTTITASLGLIKRTNISLEAFNTNVTAVNKVGRGLIQLDVVAQQTTAPVKTAQGHLDDTVVVTQVTDARKIVKPSASVTAISTVSIEVLKIPQTPVLMESQFVQSVNTDNSKITNTSVTANSVSSMSISAVKTARATPALSAATTLTFGLQVTRLRLANSQQSAVATVLAPAIKTARTGAELEAFDTVLATGTKISFDPVLQLTIIPENRIILILEEERLLMVPEETRVNMVRKIAI